MKYLTLISLVMSLLTFKCVKAQKKSFGYNSLNIKNQNVLSIAKEIANYNSIEESAIGVAGSKGSQYIRFEELMKEANENELIELTKHPNPAVRGYAFWGLAHLKSSQLEKIIDQHIDDKEKIEYVSGCEILSYTVIQIMIDAATPVLSKEKIQAFKTKAKIKS